MSARLAADEGERRQLLADVSHELRTPLSVIQGNVEGILDGLYPADRAHLEPILEETQLLERLVEDLRTLSLSESGALRLQREPTDLAESADRGGRRLSRAGRRGRHSTGAIHRRGPATDGAGPGAHAPGDRQPAGQRPALHALWRHGEVDAGTSPIGGVEITVSDTGSGIAADDLPHVFDRFYRSADSGGSGLGLPIARSLIEAHGGTIEALTPPGGGTQVRILIERRTDDE